MNNARLYQVLKAPVFSEKSQILGDTLGVQVFKVDTNATKKEIKKAVELMFEGVEVVKVNPLIERNLLPLPVHLTVAIASRPKSIAPLSRAQLSIM